MSNDTPTVWGQALAPETPGNIIMISKNLL